MWNRPAGKDSFCASNKLIVFWKLKFLITFLSIFYYLYFKNRGRYVNHVVIQENPVIMQDSDKTVRVECAFTAEDQTVSFRPTGNGDGRLENGGGISVT